MFIQLLTLKYFSEMLYLAKYREKPTAGPLSPGGGIVMAAAVSSYTA